MELDQDLRALQEVRDLVARGKRAVEAFHGASQADVDRVCRTMAEAGAAAAHDLARLAVEETGIGRVHYKVLKNLFGSEGVWKSIEKEKSVGIIHRDERLGVLEVATPVGVVAAIIPTTNPTSTALFKTLIGVKGRNAVVISPHPRAKRCIGESAEVMRRAIERAGAPPDLVTCLSNPTIESTGALMKHRDVALILATGGAGLVKAAYSSGKPAYGVGPGNVPVYVDRSADAAWLARSVVGSQSFDNATLCCSEQALVLDRPIAESVLKEMRLRGAHVCDERETQLLAAYCNRGGHMNADVVGIDPYLIAERAGFDVPRHTTVLLAHQGGVGKDWPLSIEILAPVLSVHQVDGWEEGCATCKAILHYGGLGHTTAVYARDESVLESFFVEKPASRICANGPTAQGAVGFSTHLVPSMSLGCGPQAGNITSDNISARHLLNIKRVAFPRSDWDDVERRFHARAAALTGDAAPRGSGLPGDPALRASGSRGSVGEPMRKSSPASSLGASWTGNPSVRPAAPAPSPVPGARPASAPTFTRPALGARPAPQAATRPAVKPQGRSKGAVAPATGAVAPATARAQSTASPYVGAALTPREIENLMSNAGSGCPLGPCKGCPHLDVSRNACTA